MSYGGRIGDHWDTFYLPGNKDSQTRLVDLGKLSWADKIVVPPIEPWPKLQPGEVRSVSVNVSGVNGRDGTSGLSAGRYSASSGGRIDTGGASVQSWNLPFEGETGRPGQYRDYPNHRLEEEVSSSTRKANTMKEKHGDDHFEPPTIDSDKNVKKAPKGYTPFYEVLGGHMYAIHVVEPGLDYYLLVHVDELVRGRTAKISWQKLESPKKPVF